MKVGMGIEKYIKSKRGNSSIILLIMITVLIGLMSFTVDAGLLYYEKGKLQNTVDSVALAAAARFEEGEDKMLEEANKYATLNGVDPGAVTINISENRHRVSVSTSKSVNLYFAKIFNMENAVVEAKSSAVAGPISSTKGIRPLAIAQQEFVYGQSYTLKEGGGNGYCGNYGALALGGTGASNYRSNLENGYNSNPPLKIGDVVPTETGNMPGPTLEGVKSILESDPNEHSSDLSELELNCPRLIKIPIVDSINVEGRTSVTVVGFAAFFLDDIKQNSGKTEINGRFVRIVGEGEIDETAVGYGLFGVKLVE